VPLAPLAVVATAVALMALAMAVQSSATVGEPSSVTLMSYSTPA